MLGYMLMGGNWEEKGFNKSLQEGLYWDELRR